MNLDDAQRRKVSEWIEQGLKLSEIQSKLASELNLRLTYMDVRFLIDDLKLKVKDAEPPKSAPDLAAAPASGAAPANIPAAPMPGAEPAQGRGRVSVSVDQIARAGAMVSGKVIFSDGKSAEWYLDQQGRLGLSAEDKTYRPSQQDVIDFQTELQNELAKLGY